MTARDLVTARVAQRARRFPDFDLGPLDTGGLVRRDAALARAIDHTVGRRWLTLAAVLESQLDRGWASLEPRVQAALLVGAAQLLLLERLPDHAVIHEAVEWAKANVRPKAGGLVNAVLRRVAGLRQGIVDRGHALDGGGLSPYAADELPLHDGRAWRLSEPVFDRDPNPLGRLARQTSHPEALLSTWVDQFGEQQAARLAAHSLVHPPIIVTGLGPALLEAASAGVGRASRGPSGGPSPQGPSLLPDGEAHDESGFRVFGGDHDALLGLLRHTSARVQDPATAAPVEATRRLEPALRLVIDVCAGKGTKTRQLAEVHPGARVIATDVDPARLATLREVFADHDRVEVVEHGELRPRFDNRADLLVLDVPCSNTGVLARRVEAKYRFDATSLSSVVGLGRQIIADSIPLLADAGRLLYATCSLQAEENERQAEWIARWHRMRVVSSDLRLPRGRPGGPPRHYADGGYFACLTRA